MVACDTLNRHRHDLEAARERVHRLLDELDPAVANRQPQPGSWSALQAIEHLNATATVYQPRMQRAIAEAPAGGPPYERGTLTGRLFLRSLDPSNAPKRFRAPKIFRPATTSLTATRVRDDFDRYHDAWIRLIDAADGRGLGRSRVRLPLPLPIHMSLAQAFQVHAWHVPRHVAQAERAATAVRAGAA
ncbi:MAG TPA: DinB family protein [Candidatus Krumholzibacteria bacterium]|nr:DinB family protein [Candidatus Krumholzibacteria bacterium]